jgi:hypothetical protein
VTPKADRLEEFFWRLRALPAAETFQEAVRQIETTLNAVEDELTGIPYDPSRWRSDGRLYPPQEDNMLETGRRQVGGFRSFRHRTFIGFNGAIEIRETSGRMVFSKPGADGKSVADL